MTYQEFLESKKHSSINYGIEPTFIPAILFDYQKHVSEYAIKKGRCAVFLDTGLGKTIIELVVAKNYLDHTRKQVLIITPLAVAFQFIKEASKFNIIDVEYSKYGKSSAGIVICNYERLHLFDPAMFDTVILDESSILKNFEGKIKDHITSFMKKVPYRFLFTATPSPNDFIELGTSSEALGYLGYMDMLTKYFKNNNNNVAKISQVDKARAGMKWYLKPHAENDFWNWVSSWSISMRKPSDLGFDNSHHHLPDLIETITTVRNTNPLIVNGQHSLFTMVAQNFREIRSEVRTTIEDRCNKAIEKSNRHETTVYWVNLNDESKKILELDQSSVEVSGNMSIDEKEEILMNFSNGDIKKLVTKPSITAFGLNWQHCNHTTFFPTFSYEQYYQAIRRFWRFGQTRNVYVDLIISDGQVRIMDSLLAKRHQATAMFKNLIESVGSITTNQETRNIKFHIPSFVKKVI